MSTSAQKPKQISTTLLGGVDKTERRQEMRSPISKSGLRFARRQQSDVDIEEEIATSTEPSPVSHEPARSALSQQFLKSNAKLKELMEMALSPMTPSPSSGMKRCFICWEASRIGEGLINPCTCKNENLKYVSTDMFRVSASGSRLTSGDRRMSSVLTGG